MVNSIQPVKSYDQLKHCNQMQRDIFHDELKLFGMQIPDGYDQFSVYMEILNSESLVGTYRIVLPNSSLGLPIEETGFDIKQFHPKKVCEMSRLVMLQEQRGKIPFRHIISSACRVAKQHDASIILVALLPHNRPLFKRYGFSQVGPALPDPSVESMDTEEAVIIPMQKHI